VGSSQYFQQLPLLGGAQGWVNPGMSQPIYCKRAAFGRRLTHPALWAPLRGGEIAQGVAIQSYPGRTLGTGYWQWSELLFWLESSASELPKQSVSDP